MGHHSWEVADGGIPVRRCGGRISDWNLALGTGTGGSVVGAERMRVWDREGPVGPLTRWLVIRFDLEVMEMLSERFADLLSVLGIKLHVELVLGSE